MSKTGRHWLEVKPENSSRGLNFCLGQYHYTIGSEIEWRLSAAICIDITNVLKSLWKKCIYFYIFWTKRKNFVPCFIVSGISKSTTRKESNATSSLVAGILSKDVNSSNSTSAYAKTCVKCNLFLYWASQRFISLSPPLWKRLNPCTPDTTPPIPLSTKKKQVLIGLIIYFLFTFTQTTFKSIPR